MRERIVATPFRFASILPYLAPSLIETILADPELLTPVVKRSAGAILLADIAGFTALTETTAQSGPEGLEKLTRWLNAWFGRVIDQIEEQGGEVVKFGGDSLTAFFRTTEGRLDLAAHRAYQAAEAMRRAVADWPFVEAAGERASLGMRIGIGAGDIVAMCVGGLLERREYVIAGEAVEQASRSERLARRNEIVVSPQAEHVLGSLNMPRQIPSNPNWEDVLDGGKLVANLRCYVPRPVLSWLDKGLDEWMAALHPMSVLFVGIDGIDYVDPGQVEKLHAFLNETLQSIYHYQGVLGRLALGDKGTEALILFGAPPFVYEDEPARAVRCALELVQGACSTERAVRAGIATGQVLVGPVGSARRKEYTVLGDAVNVAARLMAGAGDGDILCDYETFRSAQSQWVFETLAPVRVKGKAGLIRVYRPASEWMADALGTQRLAGISRRAVWGKSRLVGRKAEVARLEAVIRDVVNGQSRVLVVRGEAGIGKSRLAAELTRLAREQGLAWLMGVGQSTEQRIPYRAWSRIFAYYFGLDTVMDAQERRERVSSLVLEFAPQESAHLSLLDDVLNLGFADAQAAPLTADERHSNLDRLLLALLNAWAREGPLVLLIEDSQWLDRLSWNLVLQVARAPLRDSLSLLLVVITRPCDQDSLAGRHVRALGALEFATELDLAALSDPEIVALAADRLELPEESMPAALARLICRRAGGNPFFAEELVLTLLEQGIISICIPAGPAQEGQGPKQRCVVCDDLARASSSLPGTVQELVLARVERLSPECQMVLKVASVIGRAFTYETLRRTLERFTGIEEATLNDYLNLLSMLDLVPRYAIEPELTYVFKHVIIQEVVYNTLLFAQRRVLHRAVAEVLEQQSPARAQESAALLAFHWAHSDQPEKAFSYLRAGGQEREGAVRNEVAFFQIDA